jgi:RNA recognition motif-containing protein
MALENIFKQFYTTVVGSKIIKDPSTRVSKGYGFVMFASPEEADLAIEEMHGFQIMGRKIRTGKSMSKNGMAPIRGSGNGCGMVGNGMGNQNLGNEKETQPMPQMNMNYPGMMMFNSMGYPVSYSQYYNFNMINMPYTYGPGGEMIPNMQSEKALDGENIAKQEGNGFGYGNMTQEMMNNPYYAQAMQMYGNPYMKPQMPKEKEKGGNLIGKRSMEYKKEEKVKVKKVKGEKVVEKEKKRGKKGNYGWFGKKGDEKGVSGKIEELTVSKFDWFSSGESASNKFILDFFDL